MPLTLRAALFPGMVFSVIVPGSRDVRIFRVNSRAGLRGPRDAPTLRRPPDHLPACRWSGPGFAFPPQMENFFWCFVSVLQGVFT